MRFTSFAAALCVSFGLSQVSCAISELQAVVPGASQPLVVTLPPGSEQIWDQDPQKSFRFWIRDPAYTLASKDIPIFSIEYRSRENREFGAPEGRLIEAPRRTRGWGNQEAEFAVEDKGYACFADGSGGEYVAYRRVIRRDSGFGQIICELESSMPGPLVAYRSVLAKICRSAKSIDERSPHN